jgi:hypothetical protein
VTRVRVDVTEEDIASGIKKDCCKCPIARAVSRTLGWPLVTASEHGINASTCDWHVRNKTSHWCLRFMARFDDGLLVLPFTFHLEIDWL